MKEETEINIEVIDFCGVSQELSKNICNFWWRGRPVDGRLMTTAESLVVEYFSLEEALQLISNKEYREELLKIWRNVGHPFFITFD
ncbi:hypothetical protein BACCIP111883_02313 [Sutcliffiella rhizosphaerae]|uniref:Uncharacterized protein n=1 Tax=Sutcliffiella rhizosphaerae TaxID=2880967 RepID=A0ABN8A8S1_9BACI|nr:hypothetical protein BACCIP111883_02313 [Sutcliffiella rhizosphaerae]